MTASGFAMKKSILNAPKDSVYGILNKDVCGE